MRAFLLLVFMWFTSVCMAQAGRLNPNFGNGGFATLNFIPGYYALQFGQRVEYLSDGNLLVAVQSSSQTKIARYKANGSLDSSFGIDGYSPSIAVSDPVVAIQKDGKILVGGSYSNLNDFSFFIARLNQKWQA